MSDGQSMSEQIKKGSAELRNQVISAMLLFFMKNNEPNIVMPQTPTRSPAVSTGRGVQGDF